MDFIEKDHPRDEYLSQENAVNRLLKEWEDNGRLIIAYDFDNTVYDEGNTGEEHNQVIELLRACQSVGCIMIVFTCRPPKEYHIVKKYLDTIGLRHDYINENVPDLGFETSNKIFFNILFDDRAELSSAYEIMVNVLYKKFSKERWL